MNSFLLVQFREDISTGHEKDCFSKFFLGLNLEAINAFDSNLNWKDIILNLENYQGVILGGSGESFLSKKDEDYKLKRLLKRITPFINFILDKDFPTLGICFGHQILGDFLGTSVVNDAAQAETGTLNVYLTKYGKNDDIFKDIPSPFLAQFGHKDSLEKLPLNCILLAHTNKCKVASFKYKNNIYGVQFHPELDKQDIIFRLKLYPDYSSASSNDTEKNLKKSPFASRIIKKFVSKYKK